MAKIDDRLAEITARGRRAVSQALPLDAHMAVHDDVPELVAALRAVLDMTLAARLHPGSLRCMFAEDIEAAANAALGGEAK